MRTTELPALLVLTVSAVAGSGEVKKTTTRVLRPPKHGDVYVIAHRGAHNGIPENTLPAYQKAIDLGVDFIEIDVRMTRDRRFVSCHSDDVNQYTVEDTPGKISRMTLAEVRALDVGSRIGPRWQGTRIPTFAEILDLVEGKCGIYIDLKNAPVAPLIKMIAARGMEHEVLWYAYKDSDLEEIRRLCPECVIMPDPGPESNLPGVIERFRPRVIASSWKHLSARFVKTCHNAGAMVIVDDAGPETWDKMLKWKTDGIQTNAPERLIEYLDNRQRNPAP